MHPRQVTFVLALSVAGTTLGSVPARVRGCHPRVSLSGLQVPEIKRAKKEEVT